MSRLSRLGSDSSNIFIYVLCKTYFIIRSLFVKKIKWAWKTENKHVYLECESAEAVDVILYPDPSHPMAFLVSMINGLMREAWDDLQILLIYPSANQAATALANHCINGDGGIETIHSPPPAVRVMLDQDMHGDE